MPNKKAKERLARRAKRERQEKRRNKDVLDDIVAAAEAIQIVDYYTGKYIRDISTEDDPCPRGHYKEAYIYARANIKLLPCERCGEVPRFHSSEEYSNALLEQRPYPDDRCHIHEVLDEDG